MKKISFSVIIFCLTICSTHSFLDGSNLISKDFWKNLYASGVEQTTEAPETSTEAYIAENPGLRIRVTENGFDYIDKFVIEIVSDAIHNLKIPDIDAGTLGIDMKIYNISVTNFPIPEAHFELVEGKRIVYNITKLEPDIKANYIATVGFGYWETTNVGTLNISARAVSFEMDFEIGRDKDGRPKLVLSECKNKGHIGLYYKGGWSEALSVGSTFLKTKIKMMLLSQICFQAKNAVNNVMAKMMEAQEMVYLYEGIIQDMHLGPYEIHYGLTSKPQIYKKAIDLDLKAMIYYLENGDLIVPPLGELSPLLPFDDHIEKMAYLYITEYTMNSVLHGIYANELLQFTLTYRTMPKDYRYILATSCNSFFYMCIGSLFPQLRRKYPRSKAWISAKAARSPTITLQQSVAEIDAEIDMNIMVEYRRESYHIVTVKANILLALELDIVEDKVYFQVINSSYGSKVVNASLDVFSNDMFFDTLMGIGVDSIAVPQINGLGKEGIEIPEFADESTPDYPKIKLVNPEVIKNHTLDNVLIFGTDFDVTLPKIKLDFNF